MRSNKTKDMIRSVLPSTYREGARKAKARTTRENRRAVRAELRHENPETTAVDFHRAASQKENVWWRRGGDKLNHFMRWCEAITDGMTKDDALSYVRSILPSNLIGDHAYGHWESHRKYPRRRDTVSYWERRERLVQSLRDSMTFRLRRALHIAPELHGELNDTIRRRKKAGELRRLLRGMYDIASFVADISIPADYIHARDWVDPFAIERETTREFIEASEHRKGGRRAALRVSAHSYRSASIGSSFAAL